MRRILFAVLLVVACATGAVADSYDDAVTAFQCEAYTQAAQLFRPFAEKGDVLAQSGLGTVYKNGQGMPQDYEEAVEWYRLAAAQGNEDASIGLGLIYGNAYSGVLDFVRAHMWFNLAATTFSGEAR